MFPPDATDAPIIAHMSVVNWKRVKCEGWYLARVAMRSDNKSHLCVLASVDDGLFPLPAEEWLQLGGKGNLAAPS